MTPLDPEGIREPRQPARRDILKLPLVAAAYGLVPSFALALSLAPSPGADDAEGTKIAVKLTVEHTTDEELLFLKQIGLRWLHADFGKPPPMISSEDSGALPRTALRLTRPDGGLPPQRIQLGQPGRDEDIEKFNTFLTDCGRLGIRTSHIDFHPGNTYTTNMITTPRGYTAREFSVVDFRQNRRKDV